MERRRCLELAEATEGKVADGGERSEDRLRGAREAEALNKYTWKGPFDRTQSSSSPQP